MRRRSLDTLDQLPLLSPGCLMACRSSTCNNLSAVDVFDDTTSDHSFSRLRVSNPDMSWKNSGRQSIHHNGVMHSAFLTALMQTLQATLPNVFSNLCFSNTEPNSFRNEPDRAFGTNTDAQIFKIPTFKEICASVQIISHLCRVTLVNYLYLHRCTDAQSAWALGAPDCLWTFYAYNCDSQVCGTNVQ